MCVFEGKRQRERECMCVYTQFGGPNRKRHQQQTTGLGDRHPSNLMLERSTGRVVHIDFGDCFEVR